MAEATRRSGTNVRRIGLYALAVLIVVCVVLFLIGRHQLGQAARIRQDAEVKLSQATIYVVDQAMWAANAAQDEARGRNWGRARDSLARAVEGIRVMEQVAPEHMQAQIREASRKAADAEAAVAEGSGESREMISDLLQSLHALKELPLTG